MRLSKNCLNTPWKGPMDLLNRRALRVARVLRPWRSVSSDLSKMFDDERMQLAMSCLLYTSDAADDSLRVDLGGRRIIKKKKKKKIIINFFFFSSRRLHTIFFFFKQKTAYEIGVRLVGSEMCIRDSLSKIEYYLDVIHQ